MTALGRLNTITTVSVPNVKQSVSGSEHLVMFKCLQCLSRLNWQ